MSDEILGRHTKLAEDFGALKDQVHKQMMGIVTMIKTLESRIDKDPTDKEIKMYLARIKENCQFLRGYAK
jgi:hypothetical protein